MMMYFQEDEKSAAYGELLQPYVDVSALKMLEPYFDAASDMAAGAAWADIHTYLPDDLLVKVDVASMAFGLECRAPFLDVELMEWAARLPAAAKMPGGALKGLLKKAVAPLLPAEIIDRPKLGFGAPIEPWLRGDLFDLAEDVLTDPRAENRNLFQSGYAAKLLREHRNGIRLNHTRIWAMLMLELWFQTWIDPAESPTASSIKANQ
jgi:asparagine synthase (glutamine-hydrolysing)